MNDSKYVDWGELGIRLRKTGEPVQWYHYLGWPEDAVIILTIIGLVVVFTLVNITKRWE